MAKIVLISCVSKKLNQISKAQDLYVSPLFRKNLKYAKSLAPDSIFILSAKHGLLRLDDEIKPYNKTLNKMSSVEIKNWANLVLSQLRKTCNLKKDKFIFLAGINYRRFLLPQIKQFEIPMLGLGIGKQLRWLNERTKNE